MTDVIPFPRPGTTALIASRVTPGIPVVALVAAAITELIGVPAMVQIFDAIGAGQWFRIVTAVVEIIGAVALLASGFPALGALWLATTMFFATLIHLLVLHTGAAPALPLLVLNLAVAACGTGRWSACERSSLRAVLWTNHCAPG